MEVENYTLLLIEFNGEDITTMLVLLSLFFFVLGFTFAYLIFRQKQDHNDIIDG